MTSESIGSETSGPGETIPAAHDTLGEFLAVVATGDDPVLSKMFVAVIEESLPGARIRVVAAEAKSIADLAKMPDFCQAGLALVTFMTLHELPGGGAEGRGKAANVEASIRHLREHTDAYLLVTSGWFNPTVVRAIARGGADDFLGHPFKCRELVEVVERAYKRWVEKRQKEIRAPGLASDANEQRARATATEPEAPQVRSTRRTRTILVDNDNFGKMFEELLDHYLSDYFDLKFVRFETEARLRELAASDTADLICLYIGTVAWNTPPGPPPESDPSKPWKDRIRHGVEVLGELSACYRVPVIATQGTDLRADATRAGIHFLEAPFTVAAVLPIVHSAFGLAPPSGPAPAT